MPQMTLKEAADKVSELLQHNKIDQSSAALAWKVIDEGKHVQLPVYIFEGLFTEACIEYLGKITTQKRVIVMCEGVSVSAEWANLVTGHGGRWVAKVAPDGIADLLTAAFMFLA